MDNLSLGLGALVVGLLLVLFNMNNGDDRLYFGGWISIIAGFLLLARDVLALMGG